MRHFLLWSGGVESTSLLKLLLSNTTDDIVAHHIHMYNAEGRATMESQAIDTLLPRLQEIRPFAFGESEVTIMQGRLMIYDFAVQYGLGLPIMQTLGCDTILRAGCLEDDWDHFRDGDRHWVELKDTEPGASHRRRATRIAAYLGADSSDVAPYLRPYAWPKSLHMSYLGDLARFTWSCRRPVWGRMICGICHSCRERSAAMAGTSHIPEVAAAIARGEFDAIDRSIIFEPSSVQGHDRVERDRAGPAESQR